MGEYRTTLLRGVAAVLLWGLGPALSQGQSVPLPIPIPPATPPAIVSPTVVVPPTPAPLSSIVVPDSVPPVSVPDSVPPLTSPPLTDPAAPWAVPVQEPPGNGSSSNPTETPTPSDSVPTAPAANAPKFEISWNEGVFFQTKDKDFLFHIGATVQYDGAWYSQGSSLLFPGGPGRFADGANLRRGRIRTEGTMYQNVDFMFEMEFCNGFSPRGLNVQDAVNTTSDSPGPTDAWVTLKDVPFLGNVRIGNQKEWFSLEHLNSYRFLEFMERSYLFDFSQPTAFNNGFSPGISAFRTWANDRIFTGGGVYKNINNFLGFGFGDGQYAATGRVTFLPIWCPQEKYFFHIGGAQSHRDPTDDVILIRVRNEIRNAPFPLLNLVANTGLIRADSQDLYNIETAGAYRRWTYQGEYTVNMVNRAATDTIPNMGTAVFQGYYLSGLVFLTGEHRTWNPKTATFNRVIPKKNFGFHPGTWCVKGPGAWELAARYTYLNLDDKAITGGRLNDVTLGVNWYWNPNTKMQFNYDYVYIQGGQNPLARGAVHSFGTRLAYDF